MGRALQSRFLLSWSSQFRFPKFISLDVSFRIISSTNVSIPFSCFPSPVVQAALVVSSLALAPEQKCCSSLSQPHVSHIRGPKSGLFASLQPDFTRCAQIKLSVTQTDWDSALCGSSICLMVYHCSHLFCLWLLYIKSPFVCITPFEAIIPSLRGIY